MRLVFSLALLCILPVVASANHRTASAGGCSGSQAVASGCSGGVGGAWRHLAPSNGILAKFRAHRAAAPASASISTTTTTTIRAAQPLPKGPANCTCGAAGCPGNKK